MEEIALATLVSTDADTAATKQAFVWGQEDAAGGVSMAGSLYFVINSALWCAYNQGYAAGLEVCKALGKDVEQEEQALASFGVYNPDDPKDKLEISIDDYMLDEDRENERAEWHYKHYPHMY